ncbi:unnamed protein product [Clonostachys rosea f. rosea IK726]|uniref:Uncharacterized protein n=1 Tax=Clonostachys rosea f. rosea IK726 TaxID=1349383 RepID=A0ACA9U6M3_BIOOC|nr:unnamed protein product [Clonostachys rosea f. rosea IK726]
MTSFPFQVALAMMLRMCLAMNDVQNANPGSHASPVGMTTPETSPKVPRAITLSTGFPGGPEWQPSGTKDQDTLPGTGSYTIFGLVMSAVQSFVNIAAKVAYNSVTIGYQVVDDINTKIVADTVSTTLKVGGDFSSTRTKVAGDLVLILAKIRSDFVATGTKIGNDIGNTANNILRGDDATSILKNLTRNTLSTVVNVLEDSINTIAMINGVLSSTLAKVLSDSSSTASKVVNNYLSTVGLVTTDVETTALNLRASTTTAVRAANRQLASRAAEVFLKYAVNVFTAAGDTAAVDTILQVAHRSLQATTQMLSGAGLILRGILTNDINDDTLFFILNHLHDLLGFLYDLVKPGNVVPAYPGDYVIKKGPGEADEFPGGNNPYNEFDLRREQNRYAIACQVQRVGLTFINILQMGRETSPWGLNNLEMNVRLSSDFDANGNSPSPIYISRLEEKLESPRNEKWLFINGIANELTWFQRSCDKIRDTFKREVHGIYNRSDGILWDLIECCGESSAVKKRSNELIERTQSSKAAQECLEKELTDALWPTDSSAPDKVIMIAHSQGCLILRLVLQKLVSENPVGSERMRNMKKRLRVFTFGNPSIDWLAIGEPAQSLGEHASVTEHFAHDLDFVARLGIVTHAADPDSGYDVDSIFYSKKGRGHLFGAHYPLGENAYINAGRSKLLSAVDGRAIH